MSLREAAEEGEEPPDGDWAGLVALHVNAALGAANLPTPVAGSPAVLRLHLAFQEHLYELADWALRRHEGVMAPPGARRGTADALSP